MPIADPESLPRAKEFAELLVETEPISHDQLLILFDSKIGDDEIQAAQQLVDAGLYETVSDVLYVRGEMEGDEYFQSFYRRKYVYDSESYQYVLTDAGLDAFNLSRRDLDEDQYGEGEYPVHRCNHEDRVKNGNKSVCVKCGNAWV